MMQSGAAFRCLFLESLIHFGMTVKLPIMYCSATLHVSKLCFKFRNIESEFAISCINYLKEIQWKVTLTLSSVLEVHFTAMRPGAWNVR